MKRIKRMAHNMLLGAITIVALYIVAFSVDFPIPDLAKQALLVISLLWFSAFVYANA